MSDESAPYIVYSDGSSVTLTDYSYAEFVIGDFLVASKFDGTNNTKISFISLSGQGDQQNTLNLIGSYNVDGKAYIIDARGVVDDTHQNLLYAELLFVINQKLKLGRFMRKEDGTGTLVLTGVNLEETFNHYSLWYPIQNSAAKIFGFSSKKVGVVVAATTEVAPETNE
jgi:hypothetical protein